MKPNIEKSSTPSADYVTQLAQRLDLDIAKSTSEIREINEDIHVLSVNAKIESARAGVHGRGFAVVADNIKLLVARTNGVTEHMDSSVKSLIGELAQLSGKLGVDVRGQRFSQTAYNVIDIIDRNLYERSCDVRWWATDDSLVATLTDEDQELTTRVGERLGLILDSYTVYFDLILMDTTGKILVNGRPEQFRNKGLSVGDAPWFRQSLALDHGQEFTQESVHVSHLVNNQEILIYSTAIRKQGQTRGEVIGSLGLLFRWKELSQTALLRAWDYLKNQEGDTDGLGLCIFEPDGRIIASYGDLGFERSVPHQIIHSIGSTPLGYTQITLGNEKSLVGFALSPGFETYSTGWYCLVKKVI